MTRHSGFFLSSLILVAVLLSGGCTPKSVPVMVKGEPLFYSMEEYGATILSTQEARKLVAKLAPAKQGLRSWNDLEFAVRQSLSFAASRPATSAALRFPEVSATWGDLARSQAMLHSLLPKLDANPDLLATTFRWVRLGPDFSFTGYYEPTLKASRVPTRELPHPLYRRPKDLRNGVRYHTRNAIDRKGVLKGKGLEIAYVDETDAYFLQVQGSGRLAYADGRTAHVLYDGKNNRTYASLGRIMKERGLLPPEGVSMQAIRAYLAEHPEQRAELFDQNPSYVFFKTAQNGPFGSMGKVITPWVSLAVDRRVLPQGSITMIAVPLPGPDGEPTEAFPALTLPQDSGGAIKGHRIDLFCGADAKATYIAGHLNAKGAVYILLPRQLAGGPQSAPAPEGAPPRDTPQSEIPPVAQPAAHLSEQGQAETGQDNGAGESSTIEDALKDLSAK